MFGHFFNNIRSLQIKAAAKTHNVKIPNRVKEDLKLCKLFLKRARDGVSMNVITFRKPSICYINDAAEHGLGGFADHGRAWRFEIPDHLLGRAHINLLEYIAQVIPIWIDILEKTTKQEDCLLGIGDSTTALDWMRRSNFREKDETDIDWKVKQQVSRKLAELILQSNTVLYKQWFRGEDNVVADSLSRDLYYLPCKSHEQFLFSTVPSQLPANFRILPVPGEVSCFVTSILQQFPVKKQRLMQRKPSELAHSNTGKLSCLALDLKSQSSSKELTTSTKTSSCQHLHKLSEKVLSLKDIKGIWWKEQSKPPCHMWLRPSGQSINQTPDWTKTVKHASS